GEQVAVEVEQRSGAGEGQPPDLVLHGAFGQEALIEVVGVEAVVEVGGQRLERLGQVEAVPGDVAEDGDVGDLLGLQARGELRLDAVVALEDLHFAVDLVLLLVERVDVGLDHLGIVRGERAPQHHPLTALELGWGLTAGLLEDQAAGVAEPEAAREHGYTSGGEAGPQELPAGWGRGTGGAPTWRRDMHDSPSTGWRDRAVSDRCGRPHRRVR